MVNKSHWEDVYTRKRPDEVSWFLKSPNMSMDLIKQLGLKNSDRIIDVGGGASRLVDSLLLEGFQKVSVLDLSVVSLKTSQERLGPKALDVTWLEADITKFQLPENEYKLWHDRAVFHFMTSYEKRDAYIKNLKTALSYSGFAIISTFSENGPEKCSGLPVMRYSIDGLSDQLGPEFTLIKSASESHNTPSGGTQEFVYGLFNYCS